ncbi:outer membrane beta-barrel protein [Adhaeribacter rhizoryzae]|uniref:Outer membrane beta-barrel protein n=1 Tax=Adhaeribacter rhizoryzae TaxID=2607907 RepID=A0A5M6DP57_9BACT|nr:outer membrane beta-barrel protein [Adhaeribacter rhizoryzae]KAA5549274.1 outer membrane beta-barrel protein [Adhaeribacter rhizoryzae]
MKKFFLLLAFPAFFTIAANAQDTPESRKPEAGDITTEVNLGLFNNGITLNNILNQLRGRYFLSPTMAVRLGVNANLDSWENEPNQNNNNSNTTSRTTNFNISPGIEKHFAGTSRLSPYIGAEVAFVTNSFKETQERDSSNPNKIEYKNGRIHDGGGVSYRAHTRTGLNAVAGADYYFAEHFYAGLEVGYGLAITKYKDAEMLINNVSVSKIEGDKSFSLGAYANNGIRIGFVF